MCLIKVIRFESLGESWGYIIKNWGEAIDSIDKKWIDVRIIDKYKLKRYLSFWECGLWAN